ncbi:MAG: prolipoprotein diacylglyceryl transferase family protein [Christensenellales bacterium]
MIILGQTFSVYGLYLTAGCLLAGLLLLGLCRGEERLKNAAALTCLLSPVLGLILARTLYCLFDINFLQVASLKNALDLSTGGLSMFGALLGAILGAMLAARAAGLKQRRWLDLVTPAFFLFIAAARLGEGWTSLGISRPLITGVLEDTFLAFRDEYDAYLRTYYLESAAGIVMFLAALRGLRQAGRREGDTALTGALVFGLTQTLFESLRYDGHLRFSFIGLQQVLSVVVFCLALIAFALRLVRMKRSLRLAVLSLAALPLVLGAILLIEFAIDRSQISKWLSYAAYLLVLMIPLMLGLTMRKRSGYNG